MANNWVDLGSVWSGRDLAEGERITVNVFDKVTQDMLEQTTFVAKAGRLEQLTWVMDLCALVNAQLKLIRAGVQVGDKLEIQASGHLNTFWGITDRDVQVITTTARGGNWTTDKRVNIDITQTIKIGSTIRLQVRNAKGKLLESIDFFPRPGRNTGGLCGKDFAIEINRSSAYVCAGRQNLHLIEPHWDSQSNWIWIPFNADFNVTWTVDESCGWTELGNVWSGRDLEEGERITVSVFDKVTQDVLEQLHFVPKPDRLDQFTWVMDLCEQVNRQSKLIYAADTDNGEWLIRNSGYLNKFWSTTPREVQVITTTARYENWINEKRVHIDLNNEVVVGSILQFKVQNSKGKLLETISHKVAYGRSGPGLCGLDFATRINQTSLYARAGIRTQSQIKPSAQLLSNWIFYPFNADFTVTWSVDLSPLKDLGKVWSGRDLTEGEEITVNVFDRVTQTVMEQMVFSPKADRLKQLDWVIDLCKQVNAELTLVRAGVKVDSKLEIQASADLNKFWSVTDRDVLVTTTAAHNSNWGKQINLDVLDGIVAGATLRLKVENLKGEVLETISFKPLPGRNTRFLCGKDFALHINQMSNFVHAGTWHDNQMEPSAAYTNFVWLPYNAIFTASWSVDLSSLKDVGTVWSGRDLTEGEEITVNVFDKVTQRVMEQMVFSPKADRLQQLDWVMDLCERVNAELTLVRAGVKVDSKLEIQASADLNKFWSITDRDVLVTSTAAHNSNWGKQVNLDVGDHIVAGATLRLKVENLKGEVLETISFKPLPGRNTRFLCGKDFSLHINQMSNFVRAGCWKDNQMYPSATYTNFVWLPYNANFTASWSVDLSSLKLLDRVWSGRDLTEGEEITVNVFDKVTQRVMEQMVFSPKADRLQQLDWVMDLCKQVNTELTLVRAGVKVDSKLEIQASADLNKYWSITDRDVIVITTTAHSSNWSKWVSIDVGHDIVAGATLRLKIENLKGELLETIDFKPLPGRNTKGWCGKDFAIHINQMSNFVRAGKREESFITPSATYSNAVWLPFNANFTVSWSVDLSSLKDLGEILSGRDLAEGERVTVSVFDKATQTMLEQITFVPTAGRLDQYTWVMDLCEKVNAELQLVRAGVKVDNKLEVQATGYRNRFWSITDRDVQVITTTARVGNWPAAKRVPIDMPEAFPLGATLRLKVLNSKGVLLENLDFKASPGHNTRGPGSKDFATYINERSLYVRAGAQSVQNEHQIEPSATAVNSIWVPFNADFQVSWSIDLSSLTELGEVRSGRDLAEGERITVSVLDKATQSVLEQTTFVPLPGRIGQYTWVMDLCKQVNARMQLIQAGVKADTRLEIPGSSYLNKYWNVTGRDVQVITTIASSNNWLADKRVAINMPVEFPSGATLRLNVHNSKGVLLETLGFQATPGRNTQGWGGKDFAIHINERSLYVRAGVQDGHHIQPSATYVNSIWIPFNADFKVTWSIENAEEPEEEDDDWSIDLASSFTELGEVWSGRELAEGERVTISVFDKDLHVLLEQTTFVPKGGHTGQYLWPMEMCRHINAHLALICAGTMVEDGNWDIAHSGHLNKYWTWSSRNLEVVTTVARSDNWTTENRVKIEIAKTLAANAVLRVNVRSKSGALLETLTFTPGPGRNTAGPCGHDLARHINNTSLYLRAGVQSAGNTSLIQPDEGEGKNWIWYPFNSGFSVTLSVDEAKEACKIQADRDAVEGERISLFVFDANAERLLDRITMTCQASKSNLAKDKWPTALAKRINDSSGHAKADGTVVNSRYAELHLFTTSLHLDNWVEASKITATEKLTAADRIVVKVSTSTKGTFCEAVTFTPDPARLEAKQWANDLANYINDHSLLLKAGVKDTTKKTFVPTENASTNLIWMPKDSKLKVAWEKTQLKELAPIKLEHNLAESESCKAYVLDDASDTILRDITYTPAEGRLGRYSVPRDLANLINERTALVRAGEKNGDAAPAPASSFHANRIWGQASGVRAFTTLNDMLNFDKGSAIGDRDLVENEQVRVIVKGKNTGRILEAMSFTPEDGRLGHEYWSRDVADGINERSTFIRAGQDREEDHRIEAVYEANSNFFWIPQGSGLEVEMQIVSGLDVAKPGMSSEARELFEQYMEAKKHISVDARTGKASLYIPLAELFADDSFKDPLKVGLVYEKHTGLELRFGGGNIRPKDWRAENTLMLRDGRSIKVDPDTHSVNGGDYRLDKYDLPHLQNEYGADFQLSYKDGLNEWYMLAENSFSTTGTGIDKVLVLKALELPSGEVLKLSYFESSDLVEAVKSETETLLEVEWLTRVDTAGKIISREPYLKKITVFPNSATEKKVCSFTKPAELHRDKVLAFELEGAGGSGKIIYTAKNNEEEALTGIEVEHRHVFTVDKEEVVKKYVSSETLEYADDKVSRHTLSAGGGMDELVQDYTYSESFTVLTGYFKSASPRTTFVRQHEFLEQQSFSESYGSAAVPCSKRRIQRLDTTEKRVITETCTWEGDVLVDRQSFSLDAVGNPVESINNEQITRYTYYNNYQQFKVTETEVRVEDWSLMGCLFKPIDYSVGGAPNAIGGKGGLTWGTRIDSKVEMEPAVNDYAQETFKLPVAIVHCGSYKPFSGDAESELVLRKVGDKEVPQRLTFYGYAEVGLRVRAKQKLTILQPDCMEIDVTAVQYKVADKAARAFIESLEAQINASSGDVKKAFETTLEELKKSIKAQSEANNKGYKLNSKKAASMVLETYDYHNESDKPGYGTVKSTESVQILESGKLLETSRVKTEYDYKLDPDDSNKLIITTTVSRGKEDKIVSSQTRSRLSGRLLGSTDTEGNVTVRTYDSQGNLTSETVTDAAKNTRETTCTLVSGLVWQHDMVQDGITTRIERDMLGRKVAEAVKPDAKFLETRRWTYDNMGRVTSCVETDYGAADAKIAIRESTREYDARTGTLSITNLLKDGSGKQVQKITQEQTPLPRGERFTQSGFSVERRYNPNKRIMTELYSYGGMDSGKIERSISAEGLTTSVRYLTIDDKNTETEQDKQEFEYDGYGQLTTVTPTFGAPTSYTYDAAGRLLSTTRDGAVFSNTYDTNSLATVAKESKVTKGTEAVTLGTQAVDLLGRAVEQTVAGRKTAFKYTGASTRAKLETAVKGPTPLSDYEPSHDKKTRTLSQKIGGKSSTVVFSTAGRVISFTDLTGATTTYEYDFSNRLIKSSNEHCVCTWYYHANGLLGEETITAVKADNLKMTVAYTYDGLGQETRRVFDCAGVDKLVVERTLLGDGRLKKSVLKVAGEDKYSDTYEYDDSLRLSSWTESDRPRDSWGTWTYDALGNITKVTEPFSSLVTVYDYDKEQKEQVKNFRTFLKSEKEPASDGTAFWKYDSAGRMIKGKHKFDWSYHDNGQVKSVSGGEVDSNVTSFTYDKEGRVRGYIAGPFTGTYHYCGDRVYAVVMSNSETNASPKQRSHVLRNESRACLMQDTDRDGTASRSFELRDASGTVFASVDLATKTITYFRYKPYGERYEGEHDNNWLGFKGEPINAFGQYHLGNGYRLYDPDLGRFLTRDDKSPYSVGGAAAYVFGNGDPVNHQDPSGHEVVAEYSRWGSVPAIQSTAFRIVIGAVGVLLAPFTAGTSVLLAVATTALAAISFAFDVASIIVSQSDPELAKTLEAWGQAFGIAGAAAGIAMTVHGWSSIPRNWFRPRGGPSSRAPVKPLGSSTRQLSAGTQRAINELTDMMVQDAKAAGKTRMLNAMYMEGDPTMAAAGVTPGMSLGTRFHRRAGNAGKKLYKGIVADADDAMLDFPGHILDVYTGPNVIVQKFVPPMVSETEIKSLLALPLPGMENLFK